MKNLDLSKIKWTETTKLLNTIGEDSTEFYRNLLSTPNPYSSIATKSLYDSISHRVEQKPYSFILWFIAADHIKYVEGGRKPYKGRGGAKKDGPFWTAIYKWIVDRNLPTTYNGKTYTREQQTYLITRSINEMGIKAKPYFSKTQEEALKRTPQIVDAISLDVTNYIKSKIPKSKEVK